MMETLRQSIQAIEAWKQLYQVTKKAICARSPKPWDFSVSPIFAHIDAFLQRCNDLLEVRLWLHLCLHVCTCKRVVLNSTYLPF